MSRDLVHEEHFPHARARRGWRGPSVAVMVILAVLTAGGTATAAPVARFTHSPASPVTGSPVSFDGGQSTCSPAPCTYTWEDDGPDGAGGSQWALGSGRTLTFTFRNAGTKWVRLTVRDAAGATNSTMTAITVGRPGSTPPPSEPPPPPPPPEPPPSGSCSRTATPATFASQVSAATAGQTICLASGAYGSFAGTGKAITIRMADGATGTMSLNLNGPSDGNFTVDGNHTFGTSDGLTITSADLSGGFHDITVRNSRFTGGVKMLSHPHPNVVFAHNEHTGIPNTTTGAFHLPGGSSVHSGVTIRDSWFHDFNVDGIQTGPAIDVIGNRFERLDVARTAAHSDAVQLYSGKGAGTIGSTLRGNLVRDCEQGLVAFDGSGNHVIEDNVVWNCRVHGIVLGGDRPGSRVRHNTLGGTGRNQIDCSSKSGYQPSLTWIYDNIAQYVGLTGGVNCTPGGNSHNMVRQSPSAGNFLGSPQFVGGANPTTYEGFRLAPGSPGKGAASDGLDVGIR
jgi:PKD domain/Right handed beta helix region